MGQITSVSKIGQETRFLIDQETRFLIGQETRFLIGQEFRFLIGRCNGDSDVGDIVMLVTL